MSKLLLAGATGTETHPLQLYARCAALRCRCPLLLVLKNEPTACGQSSTTEIVSVRSASVQRTGGHKCRANDGEGGGGGARAQTI